MSLYIVSSSCLLVLSLHLAPSLVVVGAAIALLLVLLDLPVLLLGNVVSSQSVCFRGYFAVSAPGYVMSGYRRLGMLCLGMDAWV